jgi:hypothetical protein
MGSLHLIGGEKGGVGKSVMARVVAQYLIDHQLPFTGYDSDRSHGSFTRFYADFASPIVIDDFASIDRVVEALVEDPAGHALVDLAAQTLRPLSAWAHASGIAEVLADCGSRLVCWHVMDDSMDSLATLDSLFAAFGTGADYVIVLNHGRGSTFAHFDASPQRALAVKHQARIIGLQRLHEASMRRIDQFSTSFWAAINRIDAGEATLGMLERQRVRMWLRRAYQELDPVFAPG